MLLLLLLLLLLSVPCSSSSASDSTCRSLMNACIAIISVLNEYANSRCSD
jgi:hypothetical protein